MSEDTRYIIRIAAGAILYEYSYAPEPYCQYETTIIPLWTMVIVMSLGSVITWCLVGGTRLFEARGHCVKCGYDLAGIDGPCPECGTNQSPLAK